MSSKSKPIKVPLSEGEIKARKEHKERAHHYTNKSMAMHIKIENGKKDHEKRVKVASMDPAAREEAARRAAARQQAAREAEARRSEALLARMRKPLSSTK